MSSPTTKRRARKNLHRVYPNLTAWRTKLNLNQREAAQLLGMSQSKYSRIERGLHTPVRAIAKRIIAKTGVPLEVLVGVA